MKLVLFSFLFAILIQLMTVDSFLLAQINRPGNTRNSFLPQRLQHPDFNMPGNNENKLPTKDYMLSGAPAVQNFTGNVQEAWVARYSYMGEETFDKVYGIATDASGNVYVTGESYDGTSDIDCATIKYSASGNQEWVARYNGPGNSYDYGYDIAVDASGNVYVTGASVGDSTSFDCATIKYNSSGIQQWVARYNNRNVNDQDGAYSIALDASGNVYVTGFSIRTEYPDFDFVTIKYSSSGEEEWVSRYNGPGNGVDEPYTVKIDNSGNVFVTGISDLTGGHNFDYATVKYSPTGTEEWVARYNGPGNSDDEVTDLALDDSGNVIVTGYSDGTGTYNYDYATVKYNTLGEEIWTARYNGPANGGDFGYAIAADKNGNVCVTGRSVPSGGSMNDYTTIMYNASGEQKWVSSYNGPQNGNDVAVAVVIDDSNNVYVGGYSNNASGSFSTGYDYATIKYNTAGEEEWAARYDGTGESEDYITDMTVDASGNVYVGGYSLGPGTSYDFTTIKYVQLTTPVELTTFTASVSGSNAVLNWQTATETNNKGFEVERYSKPTASAVGDWQSVAFINGKGTTTEKQLYSYTDNNLTAGKYIYRLKQIDFDGTYEYSGQVEVDMSIPDAFTLEQNYPNPFNPSTTINFSLAAESKVSLKIYNSIGQQVAELINSSLPAGNREVSFNASSLSSGVYFYKLEATGINGANFSSIKKMILMK